MLFFPDDKREWWEMWGFEGPRHPCFFCAHAVGEGQVFVWMGSGGSADFPPDGSMSRVVLDDMAGGESVTAAAPIFLHTTCLPLISIKFLQGYNSAREPLAEIAAS